MGNGENVVPRRALDKDDAFALIFREKTFAAVGHWLERLGVPASDRRDLVQDVLLAAYVSFHGYDPARARPERWLNRITVHLASHYRERARHRREEPLPDDFDTEIDVPPQDEQIEAQEDRLLVLDVLKALDDESCRIVIEHDIEGLSMAEIAERHSVPLSTAYKRRARGMAAFQAALFERIGGAPIVSEEEPELAVPPRDLQVPRADAWVDLLPCSSTSW